MINTTLAKNTGEENLDQLFLKKMTVIVGYFMYGFFSIASTRVLMRWKTATLLLSVSLFAEQNDLMFAVPGGLIGVGTKVDPTLCRADR